jgi:hypothetical protein
MTRTRTKGTMRSRSNILLHRGVSKEILVVRLLESGEACEL